MSRPPAGSVTSDERERWRSAAGSSHTRALRREKPSASKSSGAASGSAATSACASTAASRSPGASNASKPRSREASDLAESSARSRATSPAAPPSVTSGAASRCSTLARGASSQPTRARSTVRATMPMARACIEGVSWVAPQGCAARRSSARRGRRQEFAHKRQPQSRVIPRAMPATVVRARAGQYTSWAVLYTLNLPVGVTSQSPRMRVTSSSVRSL